MTRAHLYLSLAALALFGIAWLSGDTAAMLTLAMAAPAAPAAARPTVAWGRKREPMKTFNNVGAGTAANPQTAYSQVPRYPRTILGFLLQKGGTAFTNAFIPRIELFLGEKSLWGPVSAADVQMVERYSNGLKDSGLDAGNDSYFLPIDFTHSNVKEIGGEQIGGLDLTGLPEGALRMEVDIGAATAPTLRGEVIWGPPQGGGDLGGLMSKLIKRTYPQAAAGDFYPDVNVRGAILCRQFFKGTVLTAAVVTPFTAASHGTVNAGDGVFGAVAVASLTPAGRYVAVNIEPASNAGRFALYGPHGDLLGTFVVAVAFSIAGLSGTLADGTTDFSAGDGFTIDVLPNNTDGNINLVEVKKNEDNWWLRSDRAARFEQQRYGRTPMAGLYVADYLLDNHADSVIDTANAAALDYRVNLTAADTITLLHQVLARPTFGT